LGDVCDGWPDTKWCIDELLKIKNITYVWGNHDQWTRNWMKTKIVEEIWRSQGGCCHNRLLPRRSARFAH
jgi:fructose-1,6-bisphosphatase